MWKASQRWKKETEKTQTETSFILIFCCTIYQICYITYRPRPYTHMAEAEHPEKYNWWLNELDSLGISTLQKNGLDN
jgi:hypothetical protein